MLAILIVPFSCAFAAVYRKQRFCSSTELRDKYVKLTAHFNNTQPVWRDKFYCLGFMLPLNTIADGELR